MSKLKKLKGANMDIDLVKNKKINWKQDKCPWGVDDKQEHKCAEKNICVCDFFQGIEYGKQSPTQFLVSMFSVLTKSKEFSKFCKEPDIVLCSYGGGE